MLCFSIVLRLRRLEKSGPKNKRVRRICGPRCDKICTTPARRHDLEVKIVKNWEVRSTFGSWSRQNLHHACAPERFGSQNRKKLAWSEHFWKFKMPKFAPRLRASTIWKSKSLKTDRFGALLEVEVGKICTTPARENDLEVKIVKNWHARSTFGSWAYQNVHHACARERYWRSRDVFGGSKCFSRGRRRSSWGLQKRCQAWWIWRGSESMGFAWQAQWFRSLWCRFLKPPTQNPRKGCKVHVTEVLLCSDHFAWQLQDFVCLGSTFSWQAQYFWSMNLKIAKTYCNSEVKRAVNMSFLKEVSQKCFVFDVRSFILEGSLAQKLRFWASKLHFWRKSRTKASFLIFKASFLKEVSYKSFVFELQSFNFKGSLAQKLRFWFSKLHFWRKSRRKASFLSFKASILKEVWHKSFVFELQSFIFEGSLAEMLRFWVAKVGFWRKPRGNASFLIFKASFLKEVSQKWSFLIFKGKILNDFELQSFNFEGSLAESQLVIQSVNQSVSQSVSQLVNQSVSQLVSQSVRQSVRQSISQSDSQLVSQSVSQSVR